MPRPGLRPALGFLRRRPAEPPRPLPVPATLGALPEFGAGAR